jgi:hypothetical protein
MLRQITLEQRARPNVWAVKEASTNRPLGNFIFLDKELMFFPKDGQQLNASTLAELSDFCKKQTEWILSGKPGIYLGIPLKIHKRGGK